MTYTTLAAEHTLQKQLKFYSSSSIQFMQLSATNLTKQHNHNSTHTAKVWSWFWSTPWTQLTKVAQITPATQYQSVPALLAVITVTEFPQIQNWDDRNKFQVGNPLRVDERFWKHQRLFCPRNQASPCLCKLPLKISNLIKYKLVFPFQDETSISEWRWLFVLTAAIYCTFMTIFSVAASGNVQAFNSKAYKGVKTLTNMLITTQLINFKISGFSNCKAFF